jgi:hypothetical protein
MKIIEIKIRRFVMSYKAKEHVVMLLFENQVVIVVFVLMDYHLVQFEEISVHPRKRFHFQ